MSNVIVTVFQVKAAKVMHRIEILIGRMHELRGEVGLGHYEDAEAELDVLMVELIRLRGDMRRAAGARPAPTTRDPEPEQAVAEEPPGPPVGEPMPPDTSDT